MMKFCPYCENLCEITAKQKNEIFKIRGEEIPIEVTVLECVTCRQEFAPTEMEEANFKKAYDTFRIRHRLLFPEEIAEIRSKYELSQRALSRLLGWGEITVHNYEAGALQDEAHNSVLKFIQSPHNMLALFRENRERLSPKEAEKLEEVLNRLLREEDRDRFQHVWEKQFCEFPVGSNTGNRKFDFDKFKNVVLFLLKENGWLWKTKLLKLLFYADFAYFRRQSISITGAQYVHLDLGPVPDNYEKFLERLHDLGAIAKEFAHFNGADYLGEKLVPLQDPDAALMSPHELRCIKFVSDYFRDYSASQISEYSHQEEAYKKSRHQEVIDYHFAGTLSIQLT
jgi:putative zinc finger/helix-turn-helix YgiT family protein